MKAFRLASIVACCSIICALFSGVGFALDQDEASVTVVWSNQSPYQGSEVTVLIILESACSDNLLIYYLGFHFDWMESGRFVGFDISDDPVTVPSYGSHTFDALTITIPESASIGTHNYFVGVDGLQGGSTSFSWDSLTMTLTITDPARKTYDELVTKVASNITEADAANYQSPEAKSLLEQAKTAYAQASSFAGEENWEEATLALQEASTYLEQAYAKEQNYSGSQGLQDPLLILVGVIVAVVVVVAVLVIFFMVGRKKKQTAPVNQPTEV